MFWYLFHIGYQFGSQFHHRIGSLYDILPLFHALHRIFLLPPVDDQFFCLRYQTKREIFFKIFTELRNGTISFLLYEVIILSHSVPFSPSPFILSISFPSTSFFLSLTSLIYIVLTILDTYMLPLLPRF